MNVNSKREKLKKMCLKFGNYCQGCPLADVDENCNIDNASESTIEQYYRIAFRYEDGDKELNLTKSQIENLIVFISRNLFREIRTNDTLNNMNYICDICEIFKELKNLKKSDSKSEETD